MTSIGWQLIQLWSPPDRVQISKMSIQLPRSWFSFIGRKDDKHLHKWHSGETLQEVPCGTCKEAKNWRESLQRFQRLDYLGVSQQTPHISFGSLYSVTIIPWLSLKRWLQHFSSLARLETQAAQLEKPHSTEDWKVINLWERIDIHLLDWCSLVFL